jgi:hypothetical protein
MDYLFARWYAVARLDGKKLKALHNFENAVNKYALNKSAELKDQKILLPLWWQEGAMFLNKEFRTVWLDNKKISKRQNFNRAIKEIFSGCGITPYAVFENIDFMHRCDLAVNASVRNAGPSAKISCLINSAKTACIKQ